jgi:dienelactone hydrolase
VKRLLAIALVVLLALLVVPMLLALPGDRDQRHLERVRLEDTRYEEVSFRNEAHGLQLAGMLFVPEGAGPFPAAVIVHGSGTSRRDNGWYLTLAKYLQDHGVAVLLPDKRGSEQSEGDWRTASFRDLATDTLAAIDYLERQQEIAFSGIGVIGLSQGGHIAPVVASLTNRISFLVNIVGGALPMHEQLVYEEQHNLEQMGMLPGFSKLFAHVGAWSLIRFRQKAFWDAVGNFDPVPYWRDIEVPALVLYGEDDTNVPSQRSARALRTLGNPHIRVRIYGGSGHALESPEGAGDSILRPDALEAIREFIEAA